MYTFYVNSSVKTLKHLLSFEIRKLFLLFHILLRSTGCVTLLWIKWKVESYPAELYDNGITKKCTYRCWLKRRPLIIWCRWQLTRCGGKLERLSILQSTIVIYLCVWPFCWKWSCFLASIFIVHSIHSLLLYVSGNVLLYPGHSEDFMRR